MKFDKNNIVAGKYIKGDNILEIRSPLAECAKDEELDGFVSDSFTNGFLCACAFFSCPNDAETKGLSLKDFILNAKIGLENREIKEKIKEACSIISILDELL